MTSDSTGMANRRRIRVDERGPSASIACCTDPISLRVIQLWGDFPGSTHSCTDPISLRVIQHGMLHTYFRTGCTDSISLQGDLSAHVVFDGGLGIVRIPFLSG